MYGPLLPRILTAVEGLSPEISLEDPSVVSFHTLLQKEKLEELSLSEAGGASPSHLPVDFLPEKLPLSAETAEAAEAPEAAEFGRQCVPAEPAEAVDAPDAAEQPCRSWRNSLAAEIPESTSSEVPWVELS